MWRMIRAALFGVLLGVVGGAIVGQVYYISYLYRMVQQEKNDSIHALVYSNDNVLYEDAFGEEFSYSDLLGGLEVFNSELYFADDEDQEDTIPLPEIIQLSVLYSGSEKLTEKEMTELQVYVKQAVLYALVEKLGEDYNQTMTKDEMRKSLVMSLEYINETAKESAGEWGIDADSRATFDVQYMQENEIGGIWCPAGYYDVLKINLTE